MAIFPGFLAIPPFTEAGKLRACPPGEGQRSWKPMRRLDFSGFLTLQNGHDRIEVVMKFEGSRYGMNLPLFVVFLLVLIKVDYLVGFIRGYLTFLKFFD